ncbi:MAG: hypothetical protein OXG92_13455 [Chloroflexi bacterium]|nr:hypothetical protein [Chloroflexota bacterium]MCY3582027.1 hypothetical protein [Chloroflexota bacterium]MCY3717457.1 hypothetical protein [Chloroflexota bacterium]MDE2652094.1 hypothetical protein [Chloroflexota bacterium]MXV92170.1 hypothetical protein [Chloroflexota bacterium]
MVHALAEARRVLKVGGWLIDLRPTKRDRRIMLELPGGCLPVGGIDASATSPERDAADAVLQAALTAGQWRARYSELFEIIIDCDTVEDLRDYANKLRRSRLPDDVLPRIEAMTAHADDFLIRIHREMTIALYQGL